METTDAPFEMDLPLVHTAYCRIQQRLNCLSLLLQAKPDVLPELLNAFSWDENEMVSCSRKDIRYLYKSIFYIFVLCLDL